MHKNFLERVVEGKVRSALWQEHLNRYLFVMRFVPKRVVLDVACGTGYGTELLSKSADFIVGADISREALRYANEHYTENADKNFVLTDANNLPFRDDVFDVVVSFETIEHLDRCDLFLQGIKSVLKINGALIISTPNSKVDSFAKSSKPSNPFHIREFTGREFSKILCMFSSKKHFYGQCRYTLKDWLLQICGAYLPPFLKSSLNHFGFISQMSSPKINNENKLSSLSVYCVKKIRDFYPICSPRFFIAVVKNDKKQ